MATKITKAPKAKKAPTPKKRTMPTPANKPQQGWPKDQVKASFVEKGADAATALAEQLGIAKGRMNRWLKEWPTKGITPKAATGTTKKKTGKAVGKAVQVVNEGGRQTVTAEQGE